MSNAKTSFSLNIGPCPACEVQMIGQASAEFDTADLSTLFNDDGTQTAKVGIKITGFSVSHNCIPRTTR